MGRLGAYFLFGALSLTANAGEVANVGGAPSYQSDTPSYRTPQPMTTQSYNQSSGNRRATSPTTNNSASYSSFAPAPQPVQAYVPPRYDNGAGSTGRKWDSGGGKGDHVTIGNFETDRAGKCGAGQNLWEAAGKVMSDNVIPPHMGYNLMAHGWPRISGSQNDLNCDFGHNKQSMCTSATAAAFCQHLVDLVREDHVQLTPQQIQFLNGPAVRAALNGNTFSVAKLIQSLGGASIYSAHSGGVRAVLEKAKTGDIVRFDRNNGTGHSVIYKDNDGIQFCYWTSNTRTGGVGVQCEFIGIVSEMVVSRFPGDTENLGSHIDEARKALLGFSSDQANTLSPDSVSWASDLDCPRDNSRPLAQSNFPKD